jgi:hypothetical protein
MPFAVLSPGLTQTTFIPIKLDHSTLSSSLNKGNISINKRANIK